MIHNEAKKWCIIKWEWIVEHDGDPSSERLLAAIPELEGFIAECAYCELYNGNRETGLCVGCPLDIYSTPEGMINTKHKCLHDDHPWNIWSDNPTGKNAQKVLDLIIKTK